MTVFWRYWLLQVPGWGVLTLLLIGAHEYFELQPLVAVAIFVGWIIKDIAIYPVLKSAYVKRDVPPTASLIGSEGIARQPLSPEGYVRVRGELWAARAVGAAGTETGVTGEAQDETETIPEGATVVVEAVEGLTLHVRRSEERRSGAGAGAG